MQIDRIGDAQAIRCERSGTYAEGTCLDHQNSLYSSFDLLVRREFLVATHLTAITATQLTLQDLQRIDENAGNEDYQHAPSDIPPPRSRQRTASLTEFVFEEFLIIKIIGLRIMPWDLPTVMASRSIGTDSLRATPWVPCAAEAAVG